MDLKKLKSAVRQLSEEKGLDEEVLYQAIEVAFAAAYKRENVKNNQIIRSRFNRDSGEITFFQAKRVLADEDILPDDEQSMGEDDKRVHFNDERNIKIEDARLVQANIKSEEEILFPLETKIEFGRIAAQAAAQVIARQLRDAERVLVAEHLKGKEGLIVNGTVQRFERGAIYVGLGKTIAIIQYADKIPGERFREGDSIRALVLSIDEKARKGNFVTLSRASEAFVIQLFILESPELADGSVSIQRIVRMPGQRTKMSVTSSNENIDPVGSLVGPRGVRVLTVRSELNGGREQIDIVEYSSDKVAFVEEALSPLRPSSVSISENQRNAEVVVSDEDKYSVFDREGQNILLATELTDVDILVKDMSGNTLIEVCDGKVIKNEEFAPEPRIYGERPEKNADMKSEKEDSKEIDEKDAENVDKVSENDGEVSESENREEKNDEEKAQDMGEKDSTGDEEEETKKKSED